MSKKNRPGLWRWVVLTAMGPTTLLLLAFAPGQRYDCAQTTSELGALATQAEPQTWQEIFNEAGECATAGEGRLSFWDRAGRRFGVTRLLTSTAVEATAASGQTTHWELTNDDPTGATVTVVAQLAAPGVLSLKVTPSADATAIEACLPAVSDEHFFGLGERFGRLDLTGQVLENWTADQALERSHQTSYSPSPFVLSSRGYGLLVDTTAHATFDLRIETRRGYCVRVEASQLDLYLIYGPHPQTVIERHAQFVGLPPLPPEWAFGVWKNLIGGQARVEADVAQLHADGVPVDAIWVYDAVDDRANFGWPWQVHGPIAPGAYPDLAAMIQRLHAQNLKVLGYLNHFVYPGSAGYAEASEHGYLVQTLDGQPYLEPWTFTRRSYVDFTNPEAAAWWQMRVHFALTDLGFDGAMLDFGEAAPVDARYANGQLGALVHNQYATFYNRAAYEAGQAAKPNDFVFFARSGYVGSQPYTTGRFTGDQARSWDTHKGLPSVIPGMLNGGLSGWPYWGPDIAGFFENEPVAPNESAEARARRLEAEKELWIRWVQLGALSPTMRDMLGWQSDPVGLWTDEETLEVFRAYARLHTALKPHLYQYARIAHERGLPILRPLFLNYPAEPETYTLNDEYILGDDVLVAPVLQPGQTERRVYLPAGAWRDYWTGKAHTGPGWATVPAPLHHIPLFVREGSELQLPVPAELLK